jgi:hypothetical protein
LCHSDTHAVDREEGEVVREDGEVVVVSGSQRTTAVQRPRQVHDDPGVPAVAVAGHQAEERRQHSPADGHGDRQPAVLRPLRNPHEDGEQDKGRADGHDDLPTVPDVDRARHDEADDRDGDERDPGQSEQGSADRGLHGA